METSNSPIATFTENILLVSGAIIASLLLDSINLPIAWLLAPMIVGIVYAASKGHAQSLPNYVGLTGQAIIATVTASRFSLDALVAATDYALPLLLCIAVTGGMSLLNGFLLWRFAGIDRSTSFLGCIPGAGASLVAMSEEMGADAIAVAVLQYLRILMVSVIIPALAAIFFDNRQGELSLDGIPAGGPQALPPLLGLVILVICGSIGINLGKFLRLPSSSFLGPFFTSLLVFWLWPNAIEIPPLIFTIGLFLLGLSIGVKFDGEIARKLFKAVLIEILLVLLLIFSCWLVGYEFHLLTKVDTMTAVLGATPGGLSAMMATVIELGGNSGIVLGMQMTRMLLILMLSPFFAASFLKIKHIPDNQPLP